MEENCFVGFDHQAAQVNVIWTNIMNTLPIILSILSIIVAFFTLGWTIYRDIFIKPRTKVTAMISYIHTEKIDGAGFLQIVNDYRNPFNPTMPTEILQDMKTTQFLPFEHDCVIKENIKRLGYIDSIGRYHWIRNKDIRTVKKEYNKRFFSKQNTK